MSRQDAAKAKKGKGKQGRQAAGGSADGGIRIGAHPRARRSIRAARAWAGMGGFVLVLLLAMRAGVLPFEAVMRALAGGIVLHFIAWGFAIVLWRRLVIAELEAAHRSLRAAGAPTPPTA